MKSETESAQINMHQPRKTRTTLKFRIELWSDHSAIHRIEHEVHPATSIDGEYTGLKLDDDDEVTIQLTKTFLGDRKGYELDDREYML